MKDIRNWWAELNSITRRVVLVLLFGTIIPLFFALIRGESLSGVALNIGTEMAGALVTFILIQQLLGRKEEQQKQEEQLKLIQADAIARLRQAQTPENRQPVLDEMIELNLLQWADLSGVNLQNMDLTFAELEGTNLIMADLRGANLEKAFFSESTTLPDGNKWIPDTDLTRFTDPTHPKFWHPDRLALRVHQATTISLKVLIVDPNSASAQTLTQTLQDMPNDVSFVSHSISIKDAKRTIGENPINTIYIDVLALGLDEATKFIFNTREAKPSIQFVLYLDLGYVTTTKDNFFKGERKRFAHYLMLGKATPKSRFNKDVQRIVWQCQSNLSHFGTSENHKPTHPNNTNSV